MSRPFTVVALIATRNQADIIAQVVGALIEQGVQVYVLDAGSTDATVAALEPFRSRGVIGVEILPGETLTDDAREADESPMLRRKEALARELDADWFIHHEADEFRESLWIGERLCDAIRRVDALGYTAIDAQALSFCPTTAAEAGDRNEVRGRWLFYDPIQAADRRHITCWKGTGQPVTLTGAGGGDVQFADRHICPIRFLIRRYPANSRIHAGSEASLVRYDSETVRFDLLRHHREFERLERVARAHQDEADRLTDEDTALRRHLQAQEAELDRLRPECERLAGTVDGLRAELASKEATVATLLSSKSWRLTAPLRAADRLLRGR